MYASLGAFSWLSLTFSLALLALTVAIYRLNFHPLAKFPGPKLAAVTRYFEAYYDVVCDGQYEFKIAEMHESYGPIVRISPYELHVSDPDFFEKLYDRDGRWNKYGWAYDAHGSPGSTLATIDHDVHRYRRAAMNPFFSKSNVALRQEIISRLSSKLCHRIDQFATERKLQVRLGDALGALTRDVATEFILGKSFGNLDAEDFRGGVGNTLQESGTIWRITKHIRWYGGMIKSMPTSLVQKIGDSAVLECLRFVEDMTSTTQAIHSDHINGRLDGSSPPTVVGAILNSKLPAMEKTPERLGDEIITVAGAAFETTAFSLAVTLYHIYSNPAILQRLRDEFLSERLSTYDASLASLEKLPYLTAVIMEGLRLSPALATRMARVSPDRDLVYKAWTIPAGTPVGMTLISMHLNSQVYSEPEQFDPERWVNTNTKKQAGKAFAPFGQGTRNCLGMHLAWAELYIVIAVLVQRFDFEFDIGAGRDIKWVSDKFTIGTATRQGLKARVTRCES
ncbi:hypothetical protein JX266_004156 [Neoarthrinium moseri]|nr:hypothetical protein JX266_004156 [Neoarthrinium moseri]